METHGRPPTCLNLVSFRFVSWQPYDAEWRHDTLSNVKQMRQWAALYRASGATQPECWPKKHTHEGHTISVSDIWFVAHHLGKLATHVAEIATLEPGGARLAGRGSRRAPYPPGRVRCPPRNSFACSDPPAAAVRCSPPRATTPAQGAAMVTRPSYVRNLQKTVHTCLANPVWKDLGQNLAAKSFAIYGMQMPVAQITISSISVTSS